MFQTRNIVNVRWLLPLAIVFAMTHPMAAQEPAVKRSLLDRMLGRNGRESRVESRGQVRDSLEHSASAVRLTGGLQSSTAQSASGSRPSTLDPRPPVALDSGPVTLDQLEQLALANNPTLVQAQAATDAARGRQVQAGLYPNPNIGYVGGEIGDDGRAGQQGMSLSQEIVRGGKLQFSRAVAAHEVEQADARAEAQRYRVLNAVRTAYYAALAGQRTVARTKELQQLAEQGAKVANDLFKGGQVPKQDLLQAEIELDQARILAENAANNYKAIWKRLNAVVGLSDMNPIPLAGDLENGIAELTGDEALSRIFALSQEVRVAQAGVRRAEYALRRAQVQPIPNVTIEAGTQYDYSTRDTIVGVGLSLPLPLHNRNQGNIIAAEAELVRANREVDRVRFALTDRFASAFARYENGRQQVEKYRERMLPKAQETLALVTEGYQKGEFPFLQVLTAQRTLGQVSVSYLQALGELRASVVEIEGLLLNDGLVGDATGPVDGIGRE
jgi:outer membrane protein, heavy metal efflux system